MYKITARVAGGGRDRSVFCCFDPTIVIAALEARFPEAKVGDDLAWKDYAYFTRNETPTEGEQGAAGIAKNDALRRGPVWPFELPDPSGGVIRGGAERYSVRIWSDRPIAEPLHSEFLEFLEQLRFADVVTVESIRLEGNDEFPA